MSVRTVECKYNKCGHLFTSKARMKEHILWHFAVDPPKLEYQYAEIEYLPDGGWIVIKDLRTAEQIHGLDIGEGMGEGSGGGGSGGGASQVGSSGEVDKFRVVDILPTESQAGNVTTTTTTTTSGTASQPYTFSPVLPTQPSQLSLPSQTPLRPFNSQPLPLRSTSQSRESPFVHTAPRPNGSPSGSPSTSTRKRLPTASASPALPHASPIKKRTRLSASPFRPGNVLSSTPKIDRERGTQASTQSEDSSQFPPSSGIEGQPVVQRGKETPAKEVQRTFGFGEALGLSDKKATPDIKMGVTFGFGTR